MVLHWNQLHTYILKCYRFGLLGCTTMCFTKMFSRQEEVALHIPGLKEKVFLRKRTSDDAAFNQVFVELDYAAPFLKNFSPKVIVDAGAYVGYSAVYFTNKYPDAQIIAIEPEDSNFNLLEKNTQAYPNIKRVKAAIWSKKAKLQSANVNEREWGFRVQESEYSKTDHSKFIPSVTIPEIMEIYGLDSIDILKIDIEGAERELFSENCEAWITKCKVIVIELHDRFAPGCSKAFYSALSNIPFRQYIRGENVFVGLGEFNELLASSS